MSRKNGEIRLGGLPPGCEAFIRVSAENGQKSKKKYLDPSVTIKVYCLKDKIRGEITVISRNMGRARESAGSETRKLICSNCPLK